MEFLKPSTVGDGYRRKSELTACCMASRTFGEGGYGFSFVFNFKIFSLSSCSPGIYGSVRLAIVLQNLFIVIRLFLYMSCKIGRASCRERFWLLVVGVYFLASDYM